MKRSNISLVLLTALLSSACGARVDEAVRAQAADVWLHTGVGRSASAAQPAAGTASDGTSTEGPATAPVAAAAGTRAAANGGLLSSPNASIAPPALAGGNGGPTDIGVTGTTITTGEVADLSGPIPGLFQGAVYGTEAYYAYVNSKGGVFGRQLKMLQADSQTDCTADQNAHTSLMPRVFAFVGSFEIYDDCGTSVEQQHPEVPDISYALGPESKKNVINRFPPQVAPAGYQTGMFCHWKEQYGDAVTKVGAIYGNVPATAFSEHMIENAAVKGCGWHFTDSIVTGATQTTFNAEIAKMQSDGVKLVFEIANTQGNIAEMKREADQQNWHPIWVTPVFYASNSVQLLGNAQAAEGMSGHNLYSLFFNEDEGKNIPEVGLFQEWMHRTHPGVAVDLFAMYAWASAKLFVQTITAVGPTLTRKAFFTTIRNTHSYDAGGLLNQSDVGAHKPSNCYVLWRIHNGQFVRYDSPEKAYRCDGGFEPYTGS